MTETSIKENELVDLPAGSAPQLPALKQERKPRMPAQPRPVHYPAKIAKAILAITSEMEAVQKLGEHEFHRFRYPKWEDINEKLSPLLAKHGLIVVQSELNRSLLEQNDKGSVLAITYNFSLVNDQGEQTPPVEWTAIQRLRDQKGMTDDKAAAKCHTQAEKYFCLKQFKIRVADDVPENQRQWLPKKDSREIYKKLQEDIDSAQTEVELATWGKNSENVERKRTLPPDWQDHITARYREKLAELKGGPREIWDDQTGEIIEEQEPGADTSPEAAPAVSVPRAEAGAATSRTTESLRLSAIDADLEVAAKKGTVELLQAWGKVFPPDRKTLETAYRRRHIPTAVAADQKAAP